MKNYIGEDNKIINKLITLIKSVLFLITAFLAGGLIANYIADILVNNEAYRILLVIMVQGSVFVGVWYLIIGRFSNYKIVESVISNIRISRESFKIGVYYGTISLTIGLVISALFTALLDMPREHNSAVSDIVTGDPYMLLAILVLNLVFVAVSEEIVFRGGVHEILKNDYSTFTSAILSSLFFGSLHITKLSLDSTAIVSALIPGVGGLVYVYTYEKYDNIFVSIIAHAMNNTIVFIIVYFAGV